MNVRSRDELGWSFKVPLAARAALDFDFGFTGRVAAREVVQTRDELGFERAQLVYFGARFE